MGGRHAEQTAAAGCEQERSDPGMFLADSKNFPQVL
jgi:hypothetical protein